MAPAAKWQALMGSLMCNFWTVVTAELDNPQLSSPFLPVGGGGSGGGSWKGGRGGEALFPPTQSLNSRSEAMLFGVN